MILLTTITDVIQIVTSAAVGVDVHASYIDYDSTATVTAGRRNTEISTAATTTVVDHPASLSARNVKTLNFKNTDAALSTTLTVQHFDGSTTIDLRKVTLLPGEALSYDELGGWRTYDAAGILKVVNTAYADPKINGFRITGVTGTPVMTANSTTLSTVFMTPYTGDSIALYNGASWQIVETAEISLAVTGRTAGKPFDVFCYLGSSGATLEFLDWTSATARATGLTRVNGVWTKTGDATRRYLGTVRARSATTFHWVVSGVDAPAKFDIWNNDNRVDLGFTLSATNVATYAYTLATIRQAQGSVNYQVDVVVGLQENTFEATLTTISQNATISIARQSGIGYDSTTTFTGFVGATYNTVANINAEQSTRLVHQPAIGVHFYSWNETSVATGTCTWVNTSAVAGANVAAGMNGTWTC